MAKDYKGEKVLVVPSNLLVEMGIGEGLKGSLYVERKLKSMFDLGKAFFCDRALAEEDESLKQIIPYVIFKHAHTVFSYVRGKGTGEKRLKGNRSIGIGGHINPVDGVGLRPDYDAYKRALTREVHEEVELDIDALIENPDLFRTPKPIAFINDNSNPVGRVHLGVVHLAELPSQCVERREEQISESGFFDLTQLSGNTLTADFSTVLYDELENWSQLCVDYLLS